MTSNNSILEDLESLSGETLRLAVRLEAKLALLRRFSSSSSSDRASKYGVTMPSVPKRTKEADGKTPLVAKYDRSDTQTIISLFNEQLQKHRKGVLPRLTVATLQDLNRRVLQDSPQQPSVTPGEFRAECIQIGPESGADLELVPELVTALMSWANSSQSDLLPKLPQANAIVKAAIVHAELLRIHPFTDGNGRAARAVEFSMLLSGGVPAHFAHEPNNFYNLDRSAYNQALRTMRTEGVEHFIRYLLQGLLDCVDRRLQSLLNDRPLGRRQVLRAGFTLVELVIVILILGILAGVAAPKFLNISSDAEEAGLQETVRAVQDGIEHYYLEKLSEGQPQFPNTLDDAATGPCSYSNPFFDKVLRKPVTDADWYKDSDYEYTAPGGVAYEYDSSTGEFFEV